MYRNVKNNEITIDNKIIKAISDSVAQMKIDLDGNSKKREGFKID